MTSSPTVQSSPSTSSNGASSLDRFFATLRRSPIHRSSDRVIAGVCGGVAERLGVSTAIVRVVAVVAALLGPAVVLYLVAWLLLPKADGSLRLERAVRGGDASSIALVVVTLIAVVPDAGLRHHVGWLVPVALVAAIAWFVTRGRRERRSPSTDVPAGPSTWAPQDSSVV